jgi:hypothetical protein
MVSRSASRGVWPEIAQFWEQRMTADGAVRPPRVAPAKTADASPVHREKRREKKRANARA